ncbi:MAG: polyprenyl synthetase family protein [Candidatus Xiphinematobacter sp.]|nr:MAG: polyprenyl synthetase family protein [Candidatus Xiphinematobacter sp.]
MKRLVTLPNTVSFACKQVIELVCAHLHSVEEQILQQSCLFNPMVGSYIAHVTSKGGKRLRPILTLLAGGATGQITSEHIDLAVVLELIHTATLVHDDIIDGTDLRHSKATANAKWGNTLSVLLGDCLFSHALRLSASFANREISRKVADAATEVCSGEILQTQRRFDLQLSIADYQRIIEMKTAALLALSCELGSLVSGASASTVDTLRRFGQQLGIAYQIYDDCLDLVGSETQEGKTLGTDLEKGKFTLPILLMLHSKKLDDNDEANVRLSLLSRKRGVLETSTLISMVLKTGAVRAASRTGIRFLKRAKNSLLGIEENKHTLALHSMACQLELMLDLL